MRAKSVNNRNQNGSKIKKNGFKKIIERKKLRNIRRLRQHSFSGNTTGIFSSSSSDAVESFGRYCECLQKVSLFLFIRFFLLFTMIQEWFKRASLFSFMLCAFLKQPHSFSPSSFSISILNTHYLSDKKWNEYEEENDDYKEWIGNNDLIAIQSFTGKMQWIAYFFVFSLFFFQFIQSIQYLFQIF